MKIVVLAGGLSTERDVSLASGAGICRTLRENGHDAFLLDVYLGFPYDSDKLEEVFCHRCAECMAWTDRRCGRDRRSAGASVLS